MHCILVIERERSVPAIINTSNRNPFSSFYIPVWTFRYGLNLDGLAFVTNCLKGRNKNLEIRGIFGLQQSGRRTETIYVVLRWHYMYIMYSHLHWMSCSKNAGANKIGTKENTQQGMNQLSTGYFSTCGTLKIHYFHLLPYSFPSSVT
jgi:hypothetical protein